MDGFIDQRLSLKVESGFVSGPQWSTNVQQLASGREKRNKEWQYPLQKYTGNLHAFDASDRAELLGLFYACAGQRGAFRFRDPVDNTASNQTMIVEAGTKTPAQLVKNYTFGSTAFSRPIQAPVSGSASVATGGTPIAGTCDYGTGLFTPTDNWPATVITASFKFDVWARFSSDYVPFTAIRSDMLTAELDLLEVRI
jgi:uncharacterized protein (TIGR02217 family)